jgi:hypothetical protein
MADGRALPPRTPGRRSEHAEWRHRRAQTNRSRPPPAPSASYEECLTQSKAQALDRGSVHGVGSDGSKPSESGSHVGASCLPGSASALGWCSPRTAPGRPTRRGAGVAEGLSRPVRRAGAVCDCARRLGLDLSSAFRDAALDGPETLLSRRMRQFRPSHTLSQWRARWRSSWLTTATTLPLGSGGKSNKPGAWATTASSSTPSTSSCLRREPGGDHGGSCARLRRCEADRRGVPLGPPGRSARTPRVR